MDMKTMMLLLATIREWMIRVYYWWKMPVVLVLLYQLMQRDHLMKYNLFEAYPVGNHDNKLPCQDPVIGLLHFGCMNNYKCSPMPHLNEEDGMSAQKCVRYCSEHNYPYAGYDGCNKCFCGNSYISHKRFTSERYCKPKSADRCARVREGCSGMVSLDVFRTMFCTEDMRQGRSHDGTCNDLNFPAMGSKFYRFSRNVPAENSSEDPKLLEPNPRKISQGLLQRKTFIPVKQLNLLAASWIQFMLHDWFDHGPQDKDNPIRVPPIEEENRHHKEMLIPRTKPNNCPEDPNKPATFQNDVTHWWDGSQLYGGDIITNKKVRSFIHGKLALDEDGLLIKDKKNGLDVTGFNKNWWVGLSMMHNLFTREHNTICDMLRRHRPEWSDEKLYQKARLINTAIMVKIHTIEWTPAILNNTALREGVRLNWGLMPGKEIMTWLHQHNMTHILSSGAIKPLVGANKNLRGRNFSLTEEFVSVYRMHPLLPDSLRIRNIESKEYTDKEYSLPRYSFRHSRGIMEEHGFADLLYTFGVEYPGALTLFNYPKALMDLKLPRHQMGGETIDLGTIDVLRDRERGVPRYNDFRRLLNLKAVESFANLTTNQEHVDALKEVYSDDIEKLDLMIGCLAEEPRPDGFGFGETAFTLFLMMASRRLETDRFLTDDFTDEMYTPEGMQWIREASMTALLIRNYPKAAQLPDILSSVKNAFFPWV